MFTKMAAPMWQCFLCPANELTLKTTLACGQSFRWKENSPGIWTGVIGNKVWKLKQSQTHLYFQVFATPLVYHEGNSKTPENSDFSVKVEKEENENDSVDLQNTTQNISANLTECKQKNPNFSITVEVPDHKYKSKDKKIIGKNKHLRSQHIVNDIGDCEKMMDKHQSILQDYFQLDINLTELYDHWSSVDSNFKEIASTFPGIRMLRQDPVENLFSFICSSNNHISRISAMVGKLCSHYGETIDTVDGEVYHSFPKVSHLVGDDVEGTLRGLGFGYRAKYISQSARFIMNNHDENWIYSLRQQEYQNAKQELMKLCGVGSKVADCVCLMSLDKCGCIPVDTHVWQIAARHYMPQLQQSKSLTDKLYCEIGDFFRALWGSYAGWAHSVLFTADLKNFKVIKSTGTSGKKATKRKRQKDLNKL